MRQIHRPPSLGLVRRVFLTQVLYVMELLQNQDEGRACFSSISEFLLTHPVLSFGIQVVSRCRLRHTEVLPAEEENDSLGAGEVPRVGLSGGVWKSPA